MRRRRNVGGDADVDDGTELRVLQVHWSRRPRWRLPKTFHFHVSWSPLFSASSLFLVVLLWCFQMLLLISGYCPLPALTGIVEIFNIFNFLHRLSPGIKLRFAILFMAFSLLSFLNVLIDKILKPLIYIYIFYLIFRFFFQFQNF